MVFIVAERRIDDQRLEVRGSEGPIPIEPRVFDTLLYLIRHRERVVSKAELIAEVWQAQHVSESAVARCVMEARRALGDDGAQQRLIRTVHGRGYQLVAPVTGVEAGDRGGVAARGAAASGGRRLTVGRMALLASVVAVAAAALWLASRRPGAAADPLVSLALRPTIAIADPDVGWLAAATEDQLRLGLEQAPGVKLVELGADRHREVGELLAPAGRAPPLDGVLALSVGPSGSAGYAAIEVELVRRLASGALEHAPLGRLVLPALDPAAAPERFASAREAVPGSVMPRLLATLERERQAEPERREAWQLYLRAVTRWQPVCETGATEDLLRRSLELDPEFAPGWILMAYVRLAQAKFCSGRVGSLDDVRPLIDRAASGAPESATPSAFQATLLLYGGETEAAYALLEEQAERFPRSLEILLGRSTVLRYAGFLGESRRLYDEALEVFPALPFVSGVLAYPYRYQGDWGGFLALASGQESPHFRFYRGRATLERGDRKAAARILAPAFETHPGDLYGRLCAALLGIVEGRADEARVLLDQLARQRERQGGIDGEVTFEIGELMVMAGAPSLGLGQLALAIEQGFFCAECIERSAGLESLVGAPELAALLARARERQADFGRRFGL